jgi:hypothetical protein
MTTESNSLYTPSKETEDLINSIIEKKAKEILDVHFAEKKEDAKKGRTLSSYLDLISYFSSNASSINRNLALAGIAIIWIFKKPENTSIIPGLLNFPLWCLAISLGIDLVQYLIGSFAWKFFYEYKYYLWKKNGFKPEYAKDIEAPNSISVPIDILFFTKIVFMLIAYYNIVIYLYYKF